MSDFSNDRCEHGGLIDVDGVDCQRCDWCTKCLTVTEWNDEVCSKCGRVWGENDSECGPDCDDALKFSDMYLVYRDNETSSFYYQHWRDLAAFGGLIDDDGNDMEIVGWKEVVK